MSDSAEKLAEPLPWRDQCKVHPAAEAFPMMTNAELIELGHDIVKNGLAQPIVFYAESYKKADWQLLDGRNRLAALEAIGHRIEIGIIKGRSWRKGRPYLAVYDQDGEIIVGGDRDLTCETVADPFEFVVSANIHRRHLTGEQKRELIATLLKANPEKSNRAIAEVIKVDHKTVAAVRGSLADGGEIPHQEKHVGRDGIAQPSTKPSPPSVTATRDQCVRRIRRAVFEGAQHLSQNDRVAFFEKLRAELDDLQKVLVEVQG